MFLFVTIIAIILLVSNAVVQTSVGSFKGSTCGSIISEASPADQAIWDALLPTADFWNFFTNRSALRHEILMVDADKHSWELLVNQVVGLRKCGSRLAENVYVIAYDADTCSNLISRGISCYYNIDWNNRLGGMFTRQTGRTAQLLHMIMMGRMMTTAVALCEGHSVFLSDTDVVFYRDPIQYAFHGANIMITATGIASFLSVWGGTFFADQPTQYYTLNNGVVFYRSNEITNAFALTLVVDSVNSLTQNHDPEQGFLQKTFNKHLVDNKLLLQPCTQISDPVTFRLNSTHVNNAVGECYDCYYGHFRWQPKAGQAAVPVERHSVFRLGVYPLKRYTSYCWEPTRNLPYCVC